MATPKYRVGFNGTSTNIDCGSDTSLDGIPNGAEITVEMWFRYDISAAAYRDMIGKSDGTSGGWVLGTAGGGYDGRIYFYVALADDYVFARSSLGAHDGEWHHGVGYYNDATKTGRVALDGAWDLPNTGTGAYQADTAFNLVMGLISNGVLDGAVSWVRISDNDRYAGATGTPFTPPSLCTPPAVDGNTVEQWNFQDGVGVTLTAEVSSPTNDGTITDGTWGAIPGCVTALGTVIRSFATPGANPAGLTWDGKTLWVTDNGTGLIYQVSAVTGTIIRSFAAPGLFQEDLAWDGRYLWMPDATTALIYQIDPVTGTVIRSFVSPAATAPIGMTWDGRALWHSDFAANLIYQIDPVTGVIIRSFAEPDATPRGLTWDGKCLWVCGDTNNRIYEMDVVTGTAIRDFASPGISPRSLAWDGRALWHVDSNTDRIYQISVN